MKKIHRHQLATEFISGLLLVSTFWSGIRILQQNSTPLFSYFAFGISIILLISSHFIRALRSPLAHPAITIGLWCIGRSKATNSLLIGALQIAGGLLAWLIIIKGSSTSLTDVNSAANFDHITALHSNICLLATTFIFEIVISTNLIILISAAFIARGGKSLNSTSIGLSISSFYLIAIISCSFIRNVGSNHPNSNEEEFLFLNYILLAWFAPMLGSLIGSGIYKGIFEEKPYSTRTQH